MTTGGSASGIETRTSMTILPRGFLRTSSHAMAIARGRVIAVATNATRSERRIIEISDAIAGKSTARQQ